MYDVIKVLIVFGTFLGICAVAEWLADNAPWIGYIGAAALIVYGMSKLYKRGWE